MKKIEAIIRPETFERTKEALEKAGFIGLTVTEVSGRGRQKGISLEWRAGQYRVDMLPKIKMEMVVNDGDLTRALDVICQTARTGKEGDGMLFVFPVENAIRVRTGENGPACLSQIESQPDRPKQ
jgi:nitrogen regulatory protein P-II 1